MASATASPKQSFTFVWQIEIFSRFVKGKRFLMSPAFKSFKLNNSTWHVKINLKPDREGKELVCVGLLNECSDDSVEPLFDWEFSFLDDNKDPIFTTPVRYHNFSKNQLCDRRTGLTLEDIMVAQRSKYLPDDTLTVRVRLWHTAAKRPDEGECCFSRTLIGHEISCVIWDIEEFSNIQLDQEVIKSLYFPSTGSSGTISFSFKGNVKYPQFLKYSSMQFSFFVDFNKLSVLSCKISLLDIDKQKIKTMEDQYTFNQPLEKDVWVLQHFLTRQEILSNETQYLKRDVLSLLLEFEVNVTRDVGTTYYQPAYLKSNPRLCSPPVSKSTDLNPELETNKLENLLKNRFPSCDFELRCGDAFFPVHKLVLSAQSPVFKNLLYSMKTIQSPFYRINNMDSETLKSMLDFMYGCLIPQLHQQQQEWESVAKLYIAAVEYQFQSLEQICFSTLKSLISVSNVCGILLLADKSGNNELKSFVYDFIVENVDEVISSKEWGNLKEKKLLLAGVTLEIVRRRIEKSVRKRHSSSPRAKKDKQLESSKTEPPGKKDKQCSSPESEPRVGKKKQRLSTSPLARKDKLCSSPDTQQGTKEDEQIDSPESEILVGKKPKQRLSSSPLARKDKQCTFSDTESRAKEDKQTDSPESEPLMEKKLKKRLSSSPLASRDKLCSSPDTEPSAKEDKQVDSSESEPLIKKKLKQRIDYSPLIIKLKKHSFSDTEPRAKEDKQIDSSESEPRAKEDKQIDSSESEPREKEDKQIESSESEPSAKK